MLRKKNSWDDDRVFGCFLSVWVIGVILTIAFWATVLYLGWVWVHGNS